MDKKYLMAAEEEEKISRPPSPTLKEGKTFLDPDMTEVDDLEWKTIIPYEINTNAPKDGLMMMYI